jgi:H+-transporting ATPase
MGAGLKSISEYKGMEKDKVLELLESSESGLSQKEAEERLEKFGFNEIAQEKSSTFIEFLKRFWGPMPWLLEAALIITVLLRHYTESAIIFTLMTVNAAIGQLQSRSSQKAVELLKKKLEIRVKVLRDGNWTQKEARELVPGDVISLRLGDLVPADVYILKGQMSADESSLTGESLPKDMMEADTAYSGSIVRRGEARCVVASTGGSTYFGKTAELVRIARPVSKQEKLMLSIVRYMMYLGITASAAVSLYAFYLHRDILSILSFIVVFLIGAIPVALPAVLTIIQAAGALELSRDGVLVTRLDSIEDAASIDIFCFDKTGTITQNRLSVVDTAAFGGYSREDVVRLAALASREEGMDAIDMSVISYAKSTGVGFSGFEQQSYTPFTPASKRAEALVREGSRSFRVVKGAAGAVMGMIRDDGEGSASAAEKAVEGFAARGYRVLAVAESEDGDAGRFKLAGLLAIADPVRPDSAGMIDEIKCLGIKAMMLTGDSLPIAREIAGQVGIGSRIRQAVELRGMSPEKQLELISECDGFAEVYPEDKFSIVKLLQEAGHSVGMTGDGVNDSPALKQAELGTAVSEATDVAKASASMVLTHPGLSEIVAAVRTSRKIYQRVLTWVINKITKVVEVVVLFTAGFFWTHDMLISLLGISLLVFANDFATMSIATDNVKSTDSPNTWNVRNVTSASLVLGVLFALEDLFVVWAGLNLFRLGFPELQALVLLSLVFNTQFRILMVRERRHFWSSVPGMNLQLVSVLTAAVFALMGVYGVFMPALLPWQVLSVFCMNLVYAVMLDFVKHSIFSRLGL